jgi:hypothetical protein
MRLASRLIPWTIATAVVGGCSVSIGAGTGSMSQTALERELAAEVEAQTDSTAESVDCDGRLGAVVGESTRCAVTVDGVRADWRVRTTRVEGDDISFAWTVEDGTQALRADTITDLIGDGFTQRTGQVLAEIGCPADTIEATVGLVVDCEGTTTTGETGGITVRVSGVDGMRVDLEWKLGAAPGGEPVATE